MSRSKLLLYLAVPLACLSPRSPQGTPTQPSVEVLASTFADVDELGLGLEVVAVQLHNIPPLGVGDVTLSISALGASITAGTAINHTVAWEYADPVDPNLIVERLDIFEVGFGSLLLSALSAGNKITYTATVAGTSQPISASGTSLLVGGGGAGAGAGGGGGDCVTDCVCAFVAALGASKSGGVTTLSVAKNDPNPAQTIRNAERALRECLAACDPPVTELKDKTYNCPNPGGGTISVNITMIADGGGGGATLTGSADLVIAIAGNADPTGTGVGGNASATNNAAGGASLALGGDGGSNASSPGAGGTATSNSVGSPGGNNGGDSVAIGGDGGNGTSSGGAGGNATAQTSGLTNGATATAQGGNGGDPVTNTAAGGNGGSATARRGVQSTSHTGGTGAPGNPGTHGQGGSSSIGPSCPGCPNLNYNGGQLPNV